MNAPATQTLTTSELIARLREIDPDEAHPVRLVEGFDAYELEVVGMRQGIIYLTRNRGVR